MRRSLSSLAFSFILIHILGLNLLPTASSFSLSTLLSSKETVNGSRDSFEQSQPTQNVEGVQEDQDVIGSKNQRTMSDWAEETGNSALRQVQALAAKVAESTDGNYEEMNKSNAVAGTGGVVFQKGAEEAKVPGSLLLSPSLEVAVRSRQEEQVWSALANLEVDMQLLDNMAGQQAQLTALELTLLSLSVGAAASGPFLFGGKLTEFLAPTSAAFSAAIGIGAEYVGRVSVSDAKEIAAASICCAAEAEGLLANAERAKAITPLCVGIGATATTFSLLVPVLLENIDRMILNEIYLACPLISVLSAAVASLALQDTKSYSSRATNVGNRRFARAGLVGKTWLSSPEQITGKSDSAREKWRNFCLSVLPAPILGALIPGAALATKSIIIAAFAALQSAFFLAQCEYVLSRATDAVAVKARSAAVCDTYANQGARSAAILPFTSALSGLCAAATAAIVELPFIETLSAAGSLSSLIGEMTVVTVFPALSALFAAAASVSKARCEVQSVATEKAASTLALEYSSNDDEDPVLRPFQGVKELIQLTYKSSIYEPMQGLLRRMRRLIPQKLRNLFRRNKSPSNDESTPEPALGY